MYVGYFFRQVKPETNEKSCNEPMDTTKQGGAIRHQIGANATIDIKKKKK